MEYNFPFTTCEKPQLGSIVAQPVSAAINLVTCVCLVAILVFLAKTPFDVLLIISLILFELWHAFSHIRHIPGNIQASVIHGLVYLISALTLLVIYNVTGTVAIGFVIIAIIIDIIILFCIQNRKIAVISGVFVFAAVLIANIHVFPPLYIRVLFGLLCIGIIVFLLEHHYCEKAMNVVTLPYHAFVEMVVLTFILIFTYMMVTQISF
jgi:hypothetical protein